MSYPSESTPDESVWRRLLIVCPLLVLARRRDPRRGVRGSQPVSFWRPPTSGSPRSAGSFRQHVRLPAFALVIGLFATTAALLMQAFVFDLTERIALFAAIIVVIATNLAHVVRAAFASMGPRTLSTRSQSVRRSASRWSRSALREIAAGTLPPAVTAPAVFVIAGLSIAAKNALRGKA